MEEFIDIHKLLIVVIDTIAVWLIMMVYINQPKRIESKLFAIMNISMFGWVNFAYFARIIESKDLSILFLKIAWIVTPIFFVMIYFFTIYLLNLSKKHTALSVINIIICIILILITGIGDFVIHDILIRDGILTIRYGIAMWPFLIGIAFMIISVVYLLFYHKDHLSKEQRYRIKPYILGIVIFYINNFIFNITLPIFYEITRYYFLGDYSTVILTTLLAYAIFKHRFLNTKVLLSTLAISIIGMLLIIDIFLLSQKPSDYVLKGVIFVTYIFLSYLLQKAIWKEELQREQLIKVNTALAKSKKRYLTLAREQKDIIDVMGHEIRTPLTAIIQELNLHKKLTIPRKDEFIEAKIPPDQLKQNLKMIFETLDVTDKASTQMSFLVNDMLETARLEKKTFSLDYTTFDLVNIVESTTKVMEKTIDHTKVTITFHKTTANIPIEADETRIREVVYALLSNAIKYGHDPHKKMCTIDVFVQKKGGHAIVSIKDNGIGIAAEDISKLGRKFLRLNPYMSSNIKRPGGTGLGLFVIKGIMDHHKGQMTIKSEGLGKGATFSLMIPLQRVKKIQ